MLQKNPRLLIMVTDSCQEEVPDFMSDVVSPTLSRNSRSRNHRICKAFFRKAKGEALFISCHPGEYLIATKPSVDSFTNRLMNCIENALGIYIFMELLQKKQHI